MKKLKPSDLELQVLSVLWETGPAMVRRLLDAMPDRKKRAYTTMLSVLQVMEKKGLVTHDRQGVAHVYRPLVKKRQVLRPLLRELTHNVFGGSPSSVLQFLLKGADLSSEELADIRGLVGKLEASSKGTSEGEGDS